MRYCYNHLKIITLIPRGKVMKLKLIPLLLGLGLTTSLSAATERMCFGQVPIEASTELVAKITNAETDFFTNEKCNRFFPYYEKHVDFTPAECEANKDQLSLDKGYAPFGVFLRGTDSTGKDNIANYDWEIKNIATDAILTTYNAFNASYVFDEPGEYSATLTITAKDGSTSTDTKNITVWARDGKDYFVDSIIGDDRYNGLTQTPDNNCDANTAITGSCSGPWKTATRAFGEFSPYNITNYPNGKYTADEMCITKENVNIVRYPQGNFKIFRSSAFLADTAEKDLEGNYLPAIPTQVCSTLATQRESQLRPGDQVLFNKGQTFDMESGVNQIRSYDATNDGIQYHYEILETRSTVNVWHWPKANGVKFGAYGQGNKPIIKNTGKASHDFIKMRGTGMMGLSITDLKFDLKSNIPNALNDRAVFFNITDENPQNIVFKNIDVINMEQGILAQSKYDLSNSAQGLFIFDSYFHDSNITQLFTSNSYRNVALVNNTFDYSANHLIYSSIAHGFIYNNKLTRPAFGRTAYRLAGGTFEKPNKNVWISDNTISGWIDPRTYTEDGRAFANGLRYNFSLIDINPNTYKDRAIHDVVLTRNKISDAEIFLTLGAVENLKVHDNIFDSHDNSKAPRIFLNQDRALRPLRNVDIVGNKFIEHSSVDSYASSFLLLTNYYQTKCSDQFNHKKINITNNTFYTEQSQRRIVTFQPLKQGKDLSGTALPDLTLDQAEQFIKSEITLNNNSFISKNTSLPRIQIGGNHDSRNPDPSATVDWTSFYQGENFRLYNSESNLSSVIGLNTWSSIADTSIDNILNAVLQLNIELTWDDLILYAQENNLSPSDLEGMILNQVLASNPTYSAPGLGYSTQLTTFEKVTHWFSEIPSEIGQLFSTEESKWDDAKKLAITNNIPAKNVMLEMRK